MPSRILCVVLLTSLVTLWFFSVFWCFGAPLVPFTLVDTQIFVSTYTLLFPRVFILHALDSGFHICFRYLLRSTLLIGNVWYFFYQCWWSQYTFTIFWLPRVLIWSSLCWYLSNRFEFCSRFIYGLQLFPNFGPVSSTGFDFHAWPVFWLLFTSLLILLISVYRYFLHALHDC